ncbi:hypothetical protein [Streptomyces sp. CS147]|uniref:hypothetical protein n=1 Tax=Streptomyces sp. CS147 TaxID=2162715 RepID=UPI000D517186|nr:hypothetical protein [Streptomyces sp. CS147]PVD01204.1 hypothetical protein DBP21_19040 [Streptomyces sp. CS147]
MTVHLPGTSVAPLGRSTSLPAACGHRGGPATAERPPGTRANLALRRHEEEHGHFSAEELAEARAKIFGSVDSSKGADVA